MFYVFNKKHLSDEEAVSREIELYIIRKLKLCDITFVKGKYNFEHLYASFTHTLLQPPPYPNPNKLPVDAAKLNLELTKDYFNINKLKSRSVLISEVIDIYWYRLDHIQSTEITTKKILVKLTYLSNRLNITLIEL